MRHTNMKLNDDQQLYVISEGGGYSCWGYQVLFDKVTKLIKELGRPKFALKPEEFGKESVYEKWNALCVIGAAKNVKTGWRSTICLTPQLIKFVGKRVEVTEEDGETRRFWVGKSMGWMPCHLELSNTQSTGGPAVIGAPFKNVRVIRHNK